MGTFHKTEPYWFDSVCHLTPGGSRRITDSQVVKFDGEKYFLYDHREPDDWEVWKPELSAVEKLKLIQARQAAETDAGESCELPEPKHTNPSDWPLAARVWLYKAHLSNQHIQRMGAYWHEKMRRVVIPLPMLDGSSAWVARRVEGNIGGKYMAPSGMYRGGGALITKTQLDKTLVLTEDYLSAWRVSDATGLDTLAILGTTIRNTELAVLLEFYTRFIIWTDPDKAGIEGRRKLRDRLMRFDVPVEVRVTGLDPKLYSDEDIRKHIYDGS